MIFDLAKYKDATAAIDDSGLEISYRDLLDASTRLSHFFTSRSLVFCFCKNTVGSLLGYVSFLNGGAVPIMLDANKDSELIRKLLSVYTPNYLWLPDEESGLYGGDLLYSEWGYSLVLYSKQQVPMADELALLLTTSGSTGSPKLVRLSYDNIKSNARSIVEYLGITDVERPVTTLPMYYSYGLSVINSHLMVGSTILLTEQSVMQKEFWHFVKEQEATSMAGVPYTYEMLRRLRFFRMDLPKLTTLTQAGGRMKADLVKEYIEGAKMTNKKFFVMYGQTEATARISFLPWEYAESKYSSIGIAIPGGKIYLLDEKEDEIKESGRDGELVYAGENVSLGYAEEKADLVKKDENKGILHTGDIARRDEDGYFYITGRMKRFVKIFGNRCNLDAMESLLKDIVPDCACIGVDDLITVFVTKDGLSEIIRTYLVQKTGLNNRAFNVRLVDRIPRSESGKVLYAELNKLLD